MDKVRIGVAGLGEMGTSHARMIASGKVRRGVLAAVCSHNPAKCEQFPKVRPFSDFEAMVDSDTIDAVVIATPHKAHPWQGRTALNAGLHVMLEKPIAVNIDDGRNLIVAHTDPAQVFGVMFNLRTRPYLRRVKEMLSQGALGEIRRVDWTATEFFRTRAYYADSPWRGSWKEEGGGVLLNQAPHHLDLMQWFLGMPVVVRGMCSFGKYHDIEVEDEATAIMQYENGATATFVTSTGVAPGTTRIEISGELGKLVIEKSAVNVTKNAEPMTEFGKTASGIKDMPASIDETVAAGDEGGNYEEMLSNFCDAITDGTPLIAPGKEGLHSLELASAILLSAIEDRPVRLPLDAQAYDQAFAQLVGR